MSAVRDLSRYRDDFDDEIDSVDSLSDFEPLAKLPTSERIVFDLIRAAMDDRFVEIVLSPRNVLVVMRVQSSWHQSVARATSEAIGVILRSSGKAHRPAVSVVSEKKSLSSIADLLKARHVVTVVSPEVEVPPAQARLSDLVVDIRA